MSGDKSYLTENPAIEVTGFIGLDRFKNQLIDLIDQWNADNNQPRLRDSNSPIWDLDIVEQIIQMQEIIKAHGNKAFIPYTQDQLKQVEDKKAVPDKGAPITREVISPPTPSVLPTSEPTNPQISTNSGTRAEKRIKELQEQIRKRQEEITRKVDLKRQLEVQKNEIFHTQTREITNSNVDSFISLINDLSRKDGSASLLRTDHSKFESFKEELLSRYRFRNPYAHFKESVAPYFRKKFNVSVQNNETVFKKDDAENLKEAINEINSMFPGLLSNADVVRVLTKTIKRNKDISKIEKDEDYIKKLIEARNSLKKILTENSQAKEIGEVIGKTSSFLGISPSRITDAFNKSKKKILEVQKQGHLQQEALDRNLDSRKKWSDILKEKLGDQASELDPESLKLEGMSESFFYTIRLAKFLEQKSRESSNSITIKPFCPPKAGTLASLGDKELFGQNLETSASGTPGKVQPEVLLKILKLQDRLTESVTPDAMDEGFDEIRQINVARSLLSLKDRKIVFNEELYKETNEFLKSLKRIIQEENLRPPEEKFFGGMKESDVFNSKLKSLVNICPNAMLALGFDKKQQAVFITGMTEKMKEVAKRRFDENKKIVKRKISLTELEPVKSAGVTGFSAGASNSKNPTVGKV